MQHCYYLRELPLKQALIQEIQDICEFAIENKDILCSKTVKRNRVLRGCRNILKKGTRDDWMFTITVSKISEVQEDFEPCVIKSKGTIQQYPDWDEDDFDEE